MSSKSTNYLEGIIHNVIQLTCNNLLERYKKLYIPQQSLDNKCIILFKHLTDINKNKYIYTSEWVYYLLCSVNIRCTIHVRIFLFKNNQSAELNIPHFSRYAK